MRKYFESLESGDLLGETFLAAVLGAVLGGYEWMLAAPILNLSLHLIAYAEATNG
jgi:hypothetical protein